jgi:ubiquinone/menaquinone biosynthesis C-methylase UbiE
MNKKTQFTKLNLGCGEDIRKGYLNVDFIKKPGVNIQLNLNKLPLPFEDNSFEEILLLNILEHVNDPWLLMCEVYRISKPNSIIKIITPHFSSGNAWSDMQHKRPFSYFCFTHGNISDKFEIIANIIEFPRRTKWLKWFANKYPKIYEFNLAYIFGATDLHIQLRTKK